MSTETMNVETKAAPEITRAAQRYLEQYGDPLVMNTYLKVTILVLTAVCIALSLLTFKSQQALANMRPMIVRINDVGHAEAIDYRNFQYRPQEAENKYYLTRWAELYFSRNRFTIERDQTQSLYFLTKFLLKLDPLTYMQTMTVDVWKLLDLSTTLFIETAGGTCGGSGLTVCFNGKLDLRGIGQGNIVLYLRPDGSDFANLRATVSFLSIASLDLHASPQVLAVKIDAGIVKLSILLPGLGDLIGHPEKITEAIAAALTKINIDPEAFLKGNWQISLGGNGHNGTDGFGGNGTNGSGNNGGEMADGFGEEPSSGAPGASNTTATQERPEGPAVAGSSVNSPPNPGTGSTPGAGPTEIVNAGPCVLQYEPVTNTGKFRRTATCPGQQPMPDQDCLWAQSQVNLLAQSYLLPSAIDLTSGQTIPDFSFTSGTCTDPQYRIFATNGNACDGGVCVLLVGGGPEQSEPKRLGAISDLQAIVGAQDPRGYLLSTKPRDLTTQQWKAFYVLSKSAWNRSQRTVQSLACFMSIRGACEMFLVSWAAGTAPYSLLSRFGQMDATADIAQLSVKTTEDLKYLSSGMVAAFQTNAGQMVGWWSFEGSTPMAKVLTVESYLRTRSCWEKHGDAPPRGVRTALLSDFEASDDWSTESWKHRSWRKNPLLLFVDSTCREP
jgi:hypothetical protein